MNKWNICFVGQTQSVETAGFKEYLVQISILIFLAVGDPFKSEGFSSDPFASEDPFKDAFGGTPAKVSTKEWQNFKKGHDKFHFFNHSVEKLCMWYIVYVYY